ncbi:DNA cytosine methyltransferase [Thiocapsa rosea]|uniref:DNA (cytosine-5-)-methyltransferase n=1 Tax=Thiocapsa rosea TaxID=69360 RepID=A0A495V7B7_9GAMM|nr:DNA cytosine methyltransferase [Thiocapsa rosea]RKT43658.1 DNA (cytosine-5)-methyltransferase 1 [Thiocapsa rosea]
MALLRPSENRRRTLIDLFSGAGGMSYGFHAHPSFGVVAAFDGEHGKPSSGQGRSGCNETFRVNLGLAPISTDLARVDDTLIEAARRDFLGGQDLDVLSACPPCTGFSRTNPNNHLDDDERNSLVLRTAHWARILGPRVIVMENARELLKGNFAHHFEELRRQLERMGYDVRATVHMLDRFGLPQRRERALVIATRLPIGTKGLEDLWHGYEVERTATHVRRCIGHLPPVTAGERHPDDPFHVSPGMNGATLARLRAIPVDGGSWINLRDHRDADLLMTPAMKRYVAARDFGSHPDVYGRMAWNRPAATIKRECAHVGNGRYSHPEQHRLCTLRELALLQGFPAHYRFGGGSLANQYRHIGDAVPPLISHQLAHVVEWMFTGEKPAIANCVLPGTRLRAEDIKPTPSHTRPDRGGAECEADDLLMAHGS